MIFIIRDIAIHVCNLGLHSGHALGLGLCI